MRTLALSCICTGIAAMSIVPVLGQAQPTLETRLKVLEDRDAIRMLLVSYASTLDNRDFAGFEQLWAKDAEFVGGGNSAKGPAAIRALLQGLLTKNAAPVPGRDFHLVMNQTVDVKGDTATGFSRGTWFDEPQRDGTTATVVGCTLDVRRVLGRAEPPGAP